MKIAYDPEKFGELKPGDDVQVMGVGVVSDDGKSIEIVSIEDQELDESDEDEKDDEESEEETESPKKVTEEETDEETSILGTLHELHFIRYGKYRFKHKITLFSQTTVTPIFSILSSFYDGFMIIPITKHITGNIVRVDVITSFCPVMRQ